MALKPGTWRCLSPRWTSYVWKDVFYGVEISTCWLLQQVPEGLKPLQLSFRSLQEKRILLSASPSRLNLPFFPFSCKRLSFVVSRKPGAWQSISPAEPCFLLGHPRRAGCGEEGPPPGAPRPRPRPTPSGRPELGGSRPFPDTHGLILQRLKTPSVSPAFPVAAQNKRFGVPEAFA